MGPQGGFGGNPGGPGDELAIWAIIAIVVMGLIAMAVGLTIAIFFLLNLHRALQRCRPRNRTMEPGQVWLNLIPCFNLVWTFITVQKVAESLDNEFYDRRLREDGDFGKGIGTAYAALNVAACIPYIGGLFGIAGLVCFILYWVKIHQLRKRLEEDDEDREYDERPRRKKAAWDDRDDDRYHPDE